MKNFSPFRLRAIWVALFVLLLLSAALAFALPRLETPRPPVPVTAQPTPATAAQVRQCTRWVPIEPLGVSQYQDYYEADGQIFWAYGNQRRVVPSADIATFSVSPPGAYELDIARDKLHVYSDGLIIPDADPATFEELCIDMGAYSCYTKDKNEVLFYCGIDSPFPVRGADPATFTATSSPPDCIDNCFDAYDANHRYLNSIPI